MKIRKVLSLWLDSPNAQGLHFPSNAANAIRQIFTQCVFIIFDARWWKLMPFISIASVYYALYCSCFCCCYTYFSFAISLVRSFSLFPFWFGLVSTLSRYTKLQRLFSAYDGSAAGQTDIIECHHAKRAHTICSQQISVQSIILTVFYNFNVSLCSEWFLFCPHSILSVYLLSVFI